MKAKASKIFFNKKSSGFSLIELLMVTVIIFILSGLVVLNTMTAKTAANEASAAATLKTFLQSNYTYYTVHNTFATPGQLAAKGFVTDEFGKQETLSCGKTIFKKSGYAFIMVPTKIERKISNGGGGSSSGSGGSGSSGSGSSGNGNSGNSGNGNNGNGNNGNGNNGGGEEIIISEYLMDAIPISEFTPHVFTTGFRWFYIDSLTNVIWTINDPKRQNPCSPGEYCYDLQKMEPKYSECTPLN